MLASRMGDKLSQKLGLVFLAGGGGLFSRASSGTASNVGFCFGCGLLSTSSRLMEVMDRASLLVVASSTLLVVVTSSGTDSSMGKAIRGASSLSLVRRRCCFLDSRRRLPSFLLVRRSLLLLLMVARRDLRPCPRLDEEDRVWSLV